ncbi:unnamed protein product [Arabis nemorensis]|uniref:Uncharacterized protein n=1 Tax=Arabis nemorensis TaxID=586526 RepID=A0A565BJY1_9BRAS|nr:unnamed protein product [Arabis nemorensis]
MANSQSNCVFVHTNLNTRFTVLAHNDETISSFKENLCKEHKLCFPQFGEITISALKVEREGLYYHLPDSLILSKIFYGISKKNWFLRVDVLGVEEDMVTITPADQTCPNPPLLEERTEITKDLTLAQVPDLVIGKDVHYMDEEKDVQANQTVKKRSESKKRTRTTRDTKQPTDAAPKRSRKIVKKKDKVSGSIDGLVATSESVPISGGEKLFEAIQQETEMVSKGDALILVSESKIDENRNIKHEVDKDNGEMDAVEAK